MSKELTRKPLSPRADIGMLNALMGEQT